MNRCVTFGVLLVLCTEPAFALEKSLIDRAVAYQAKFIRDTKDRIDVLEAALDKPTKNRPLQQKITQEVRRLEASQSGKRLRDRAPIGDLIEAEIVNLRRQVEAVQKNELAALPDFSMRGTDKSDQWGVTRSLSARTVERTDGPTAFIGRGGQFVAYYDGWEHNGMGECGIGGGMYVAGTRSDKFTRNVALPIIRRFDPDELKKAVIAAREAAKLSQKEKADKVKREPNDEP